MVRCPCAIPLSAGFALSTGAPNLIETCSPGAGTAEFFAAAEVFTAAMGAAGKVVLLFVIADVAVGTGRVLGIDMMTASFLALAASAGAATFGAGTVGATTVGAGTSALGAGAAGKLSAGAAGATGTVGGAVGNVGSNAGVVVGATAVGAGTDDGKVGKVNAGVGEDSDFFVVPSSARASELGATTHNDQIS